MLTMLGILQLVLINKSMPMLTQHTIGSVSIAIVSSTRLTDKDVDCSVQFYNRKLYKLTVMYYLGC